MPWRITNRTLKLERIKGAWDSLVKALKAPSADAWLHSTVTILGVILTAVLTVLGTIISQRLTEHSPAAQSVQQGAESPKSPARLNAKDTVLHDNADPQRAPTDPSLESRGTDRLGGRGHPVALAPNNQAKQGMRVKPVEPADAATSERASPSGMLNPGDRSVPIAVLLIDETGSPAVRASEGIAQKFGGTAGLFTPRFISSGLYRQVLVGAVGPLVDLKLDRRVTSVLLGDIRESVTPDSLDHDLKVVTIVCEGKIYLARESFAYHGLSVTAKSANFVVERAREKALATMIENVVSELRRYF